MKRSILHCDINHCYAQIEEMLNPQLKLKPMAVGGNREERHGIILAKNLKAKQFGIKTGETWAEAVTKCPDLVMLEPQYHYYQKIAEQVKDIYRRYSDQVEDFGLDEAWIDLTASLRLFGSAEEIGRRIQKEVYQQQGLTISIGLSFNKIFAKMASDLVKPNGFVIVHEDNFKEIFYPLDVQDLFYVGRATKKKLHQFGIDTIGQLAQWDLTYMRRYFGKVGEMLWYFAQGEDISEVAFTSDADPVKSVGNSITAIHDLHTYQEAHLILRVLAESVASRLRNGGYKGSVVSLTMRNRYLEHWSAQMKLTRSTSLAEEILTAAKTILADKWDEAVPLRSVGISVSSLIGDSLSDQLSLFQDEHERVRQQQLEQTMDTIRQRFGFYKVKHCSLLLDERLTSFNPKQDQTIHPIGYLKQPIPTR